MDFHNYFLKIQISHSFSCKVIYEAETMEIIVTELEKNVFDILNVSQLHLVLYSEEWKLK